MAVRRSILIDAPPERVWQEFESFDRMKGWFGIGHRLLQYEPRVGGSVLLEVDIEGETKQFGGRIVVFEPARELTFEDDWIPNEGWARPTMITLRLTPALGGTLVELFHHGFEHVGDDAADQHIDYEGGWDTRHLEALRKVVQA